VYFHELPGARWVGIDENHSYDPASMLKVVLMIAYFREAEEKPALLDQKYTYTSSIDAINTSVVFDSSSTLRVGNAYSVNQLIRSMIVDSDNGAKDILLNKMDMTALKQVYDDLHIPDPAASTSEYKISPIAYSLFFRIIYNSTYLDRTYSEEAMSLLSQATFTDGLVGGVPKGTVRRTCKRKYRWIDRFS
jgi:beta-lactamase class A